MSNMIVRVLKRLWDKRVDLDFLKWFFYLLVGTIISLFAYGLFISIPDIYARLSKVGLKIGDGAYGKLNSTVLTNYIYLVLLIVAFLGLHQIREAKKARVMNSLSAFFKFIYDDKTVRNKNLIKKHEEDFSKLKVVKTYKINGDPPRYNVESIKKDIKEFEKEIGEKVKGFEKISQVINLYNNIGLMIDRNLLEFKYLPSIFPVNVIQYWELFEKYVRLRRAAADPLIINREKIEKDDFYAEHFEALYNQCRNYLAKRYL